MPTTTLPETSRNGPQSHPLLPIAKALAAAGYQPPSDLWDATLRLAQAPGVCDMLLKYVAAGRPPMDYAAHTPEMLFRPLPEGYTIASLVRDFEFEIVGAFTIAGQLYYDPKRAKATLAAMIAEGYWKTLPDGKRVQVIPAAALQFPACPQCGLRRTEIRTDCPRCGYGKAQRDIDSQAEFVDFVGTLPPAKGIASSWRCPRCRKPVASAEVRTCPACHAAIVPTRRAAPASPASSVLPPPLGSQATPKPKAAPKPATAPKPVVKPQTLKAAGPAPAVRPVKPAPAAAPPSPTPTPQAHFCPNCRTAIPAGGHFCPSCGQSLIAAPAPIAAPRTPTCIHCGAPVPANARFCGACGKPAS